MGLDKKPGECLNEHMNVKALLTRLGLGTRTGTKSVRESPVATERKRFEADVKEQFQKLKDKGLSIPVFTL
jgi:hypothetical protein